MINKYPKIHNIIENYKKLFSHNEILKGLTYTADYNDCIDELEGLYKEDNNLIDDEYLINLISYNFKLSPENRIYLIERYYDILDINLILKFIIKYHYDYNLDDNKDILKKYEVLFDNYMDDIDNGFIYLYPFSLEYINKLKGEYFNKKILVKRMSNCPVLNYPSNEVIELLKNKVNYETLLINGKINSNNLYKFKDDIKWNKIKYEDISYNIDKETLYLIYDYGVLSYRLSNLIENIIGSEFDNLKRMRNAGNF